MIIGYVRVSTVEQNEQRQLETMEKYNAEKIFCEKVSAKDIKRPKLQEMLDFVREGDTVVVHDLSRLARNTADLLSIVETLNKNGISLISSKETIDTATAAGKLMLTMIAAIAQFERDILRERQMEGISIAKKKGVYKGRKPIQIEDFCTHYNRWKQREVSKMQLAKELKISRQTLYKLFKDYEEYNKKFNV